MLPEEREKRARNMEDVLHNYAQQVLSTANQRTHDFRENMRNFALISGATATGALVLLGIDKIPAIPQLVTFGVAILLAEMVVAFYYLFTEQIVDTEHFITNSRKSVKAPAEAMLLVQDLVDGKITPEEFDLRFVEKEKENAKFVHERNIKLANGSFIKNDKRPWRKVLILMLGSGVGLIILGILLPQLCN